MLIFSLGCQCTMNLLHLPFFSSKGNCNQASLSMPEPSMMPFDDTALGGVVEKDLN